MDVRHAGRRLRAFGGDVRGFVLLAGVGLLLVCAAPGRAAHHRRHGCAAPRVGRFTPDPRSAKCWSRRAFGPYWRVGVCIAYRESRFELGVSSGTSWGPWQIYRSKTVHSWLNTYRVTHSWRYAARAAHRVAWHPAKNGQRGYYSFAPWQDGCA